MFFFPVMHVSLASLLPTPLLCKTLFCSTIILPFHLPSFYYFIYHHFTISNCPLWQVWANSFNSILTYNYKFNWKMLLKCAFHLHVLHSLFKYLIHSSHHHHRFLISSFLSQFEFKFKFKFIDSFYFMYQIHLHHTATDLHWLAFDWIALLTYLTGFISWWFWVGFSSSRVSFVFGYFISNVMYFTACHLQAHSCERICRLNLFYCC